MRVESGASNYYDSLITGGSFLTILDRLIAQGGLTWAAVNERFQGNLLEIIESFASNFLSIRNPSIQSDYGLGHFMRSISPSVGDLYVSGGVSFAFGSPAIFIYYFGIPLALVIFSFLALILLKFTKLYLTTLNERRPWEFLVLSLIGRTSIQDLFENGDYTKINLRLVIYLAFYIVLRLSRASKNEPIPGAIHRGKEFPSVPLPNRTLWPV
jgi:hypothetical protein